MKKLLGILLMVLTLALTVPCYALDLGYGLNLDTKIFAGIPFSASTSTVGQINTLNFLTRNAQWYVRGEAGIRYKIFRPFIYFETATHDFATKCAGLDIAVYSMKQATVGVRGAYVFQQRIGVDNREFGLMGIFMELK